MFSSQEECRQACTSHLETGREKVTDKDENLLTKGVSEASPVSQIHLMALATMARARNSSQKGDGSVLEYDIEELSIKQELQVTDEKPDHMVQLEPETGIDIEAAADELFDIDHADVDDVKTIDDTTTMKELAYEPELKESLDQEETKEQLDPETGVDVEAIHEKNNQHLEPELGIDIEGDIGGIEKSQRSEKLGTESKCGIKSNYLPLIVCSAFILIFIW